MKSFNLVFLFAATSLYEAKTNKPAFPLRSPITILNTSDTSACPPHTIIDKEVDKHEGLLQAEAEFLFRPCGCGGPGWDSVAYYDFSEQECPPGFSRVYGKWNNISCQPNNANNRHGDCGLLFHHSSLVLPVKGRSYSSVCGRIRGHGWGYAFYNAIICNTSLEESYVSGISLTHGPPGSRSHIWTFAAANGEGDTPSTTSYNCPCSNTEIPWPHITPGYVREDYFCDSNYQFFTNNKTFIQDHNDDLWEGQGCGPTSSCCESTRYFCKHLTYSTSDNLEIRLFTFTDKSSMSLIEIHMK